MQISNFFELFSPRGMPAHIMICLRSSFFSKNKSLSLSKVVSGSNFRVKMVEIGRLAFIRCLGSPKRSRISQFLFHKAHSRYSGYIVGLLTFGERWSSNSGVYEGERRTSRRRSAVWLRGATARPSTEISGAITTQFCFSFSLRASLICRAGYTLALPRVSILNFITS